MSRPTPKGEARPGPLRPNPQGPHRRATVSVAAAGAPKGQARARAPPSGFPLRSDGTRSVPDASRPEVRPSEEGRGILSFFRTHARDLTSASDGGGKIPPHCLAFQPECIPRPPPRFASRRSPGLAGGELRKGTGSLSKAMGPTWRSLTPRGEWLPPKRNTAGVASR